MGEKVPTLMQHLQQLAEDHGRDGTVAEFIEFCNEYLDRHRTVQTYPADANIGIVLANNVRLLVHPPSGAGMGGMQNSGAVDVTEGKTQPGQEGVLPGEDHQVI
jgi:hypothetical protein